MSGLAPFSIRVLCIAEGRLDGVEKHRTDCELARGISLLRPTTSGEKRQIRNEYSLYD